jgi:RHH-type rel operon transcriptional repressor/antitoxin RelB
MLMVRARCPVEWQQQIRAIALVSGRREAEVVRNANALYLGKTDANSVKGAMLL